MLLITGAAGFIGEYCMRHLSKEYDILATDRQELPSSVKGGLQFVRGNIEDSYFLQGLFSNYKIDAVLHLAAEKSLVVVSLMPYCENRTNKNTGQGLRKLLDLMSLHIAGIGYYYLPDRLIYPNMDNSVFAKERFLFAAGLVSSVDVYEFCGDRRYCSTDC